MDQIRCYLRQSVTKSFSRPQLKLLFSLSNEHFETTERFASSFVCFQQESCFDRIVDEIVDETAACELFGPHWSLIDVSAGAQRRCIDDEVITDELSPGQILEWNSKRVSERLCLGRIACKQLHVRLLLLQGPDARARSATRADDRDSCIAQSCKPAE